MVNEIAGAIETLLREDVDRHDINEVIETMHKYRNMATVRITDHIDILKLHELLQKTKITINRHTTTLWDLEADGLYESDQSHSFQSHCVVKFEDYPRNHVAIKLINLCNDICKDLKAFYESTG